MKKWLAAMGWLVVWTATVGAWKPTGWVYHNYPWAYDAASGDWYWFNTPDTQWVVRMSSGQWAKLQNSALATGWAFYNWAFAFCDSQGAWYWINEPDTQWVVNMRSSQWSTFGASTIPDDMVSMASGLRVGWDTIYNMSFNLYLAKPVFVDMYEVPKAHWDAVRAWGGGQGYNDLPAGGGQGAEPSGAFGELVRLREVVQREEPARRDGGGLLHGRGIRTGVQDGDAGDGARENECAGFPFADGGGVGGGGARGDEQRVVSVSDGCGANLPPVGELL